MGYLYLYLYTIQPVIQRVVSWISSLTDLILLTYWSQRTVCYYYDYYYAAFDESQAFIMELTKLRKVYYWVSQWIFLIGEYSAKLQARAWLQLTGSGGGARNDKDQQAEIRSQHAERSTVIVPFHIASFASGPSPPLRLSAANLLYC